MCKHFVSGGGQCKRRVSTPYTRRNPTISRLLVIGNFHTSPPASVRPHRFGLFRPNLPGHTSKQGDSPRTGQNTPATPRPHNRAVLRSLLLLVSLLVSARAARQRASGAPEGEAHRPAGVVPVKAAHVLISGRYSNRRESLAALGFESDSHLINKSVGGKSLYVGERAV